MRIFTINAVPYGSTYRIACELSKAAKEVGSITTIYTGYSTHPVQESQNDSRHISGSKPDKVIHMVLARATGLNGCFSVFSTRKILWKIKRFSPEILHLHNLHGWYINLPMLFRYIKKHNVRVVWTLHDCWSFTGHCPHFDMIGCEKWKTGCHHCPQYKEYPASLFDNSRFMYKLKKKWFTGVKDMTIVTPSAWLAGLVKESFLKEYPVQVIHNGIDLDVFKPTESDFRKKYGLEDKHIILGVAFGWGDRKGLDVFIEMAKRLDDRYQIVLVGTDDETDKLLPDNVLSIHRTQNQTELAEIYTAADLFVNPTREENYPTVNMEAIASGTPVLTFRTGGSPEILDETCGAVVEKNDVDAMERQIVRICTENVFTETDCLIFAKNIEKNKRFEEYIRLYRSEL